MTAGAVPGRKPLLAAAAPVALLAAVVAQMTVVNRLPLPGGGGPDLVLLLVTAIAVTATPVAGALTGFGGGLALDVAPPAAHYAGEYALVFCLAGYAAARVAGAVAEAGGERTPGTALAVMAAAAAAGEAGKALLGLLLSDPHVTGPQISRVLPGAIVYDLLLSPLALWLVRLAAGGEPERAPRPVFARAERLGAAFRLASAGAAPDLRLAGSGRPRQAPPPARREPRLRLAGARSPALARTSAASSQAARPPLAGGRAGPPRAEAAAGRSPLSRPGPNERGILPGRQAAAGRGPGGQAQLRRLRHELRNRGQGARPEPVHRGARTPGPRHAEGLAAHGPAGRGRPGGGRGRPARTAPRQARRAAAGAGQRLAARCRSRSRGRPPLGAGQGLAARCRSRSRGRPPLGAGQGLAARVAAAQAGPAAGRPVWPLAAPLPRQGPLAGPQEVAAIPPDGPAADGRPPVIPRSRRRLLGLYVIATAMLVALGGRLWYLQVLDTTHYRQLAQVNQTRTIVVPAVRGMITDDTGTPLVRNKTSMVVSVNMMQLSQTTSDNGRSVLARLAPLLGMPDKVLAEKVRLCTRGVPAPCWPGSPYQPIPVAQHVSMRTALQIMEEPRRFPGVTAGVQPVVDYPMPGGANPAQVLGYLQPITPAEMAREHLPQTGFAGADLVGQAGLEARYNTALAGRPGTRIVSVNAAGDVLGTVGGTQAATGDTLVTSLNAGVQRVAQQALSDAIARSRAAGNNVNQGAAVVETTGGRIVAMASYPDYNPSVWTNGISQREFSYLFGAASGEPVMNWATQGQYAPGSTFKITSTAAAVADGFSLNGLYNCPASVNIGGRTFINDGEPNLGSMPFSEALIQSCDTVYYDIAYQMWLRDNPKANSVPSPKAPAQRMQQMELAWGFGHFTGIDLPEESPGTIPTRQWLYWLWKDNAHQGQNWCKNGRANGTYVQQIEYQDCLDGYVWEPGQAAIAAIGQGYVTATPLQLANAYTALANGGTLYSPRVGEALVSASGKLVRKISPPVIRRLPVASGTLAYMRAALAGVVTQGTAAGAFAGFPLGKVCVAGKTGTAQIMGKNATSVFASFAPCAHPKLVVVVMLPDSGYGSDSAAPAVRQIWDGIFGLEGRKAALPGGTLPPLPSLGGRR